MTKIRLVTKINAPIETVFDLSRNIDIHQFSASHTHEKAIAGTTSGLINPGETVTWKGKHFGFYLRHKSKITAFDFPEYFVDEMEKGHFRSFRHEHLFETRNGITIMTDILCYETPYGIFGKWFDRLVLEKHMGNFLESRNRILKNLAEKTY